MATLAEIRTEFIKMSGRYDLVANGDLVANVDNGANYFIQVGLRWLHGFKRPTIEHRYMKVLALNDYFLAVENLIHIEQVRVIFEADNVDSKLTRLTFDEFRANFPRPASDWTADVPTHWAYNIDILSPTLETDIPDGAEGQEDVRLLPFISDYIRNGNFSAGDIPPSKADFWQHVPAQGVSWDDVNLEIDAAASGQDPLLSQNFSDMLASPVPTNTYRVTYTISNYVAGTVEVTLGGTAGTGRSANGTFVEDIICGTTQTDLRFASTGGAATLTIDTVTMLTVAVADPIHPLERRGLLFYPKANKAYTMEVYGDFFHSEFDNDNEENWWSIQHPDVLAMAAAFMVEQRQGSMARINYFRETLQHQLEFIEHDFIEEEMNAYNLHEFMGRH